MEERFDKLERMIGSLATRMDERFEDVNQRMGARFGEVTQRMDARFQGVTQEMAAGFLEVSQRIGVLHEDVKSDIRFGLEARQALQDVMETGFANQERSFKEALAPIADAIRASFRK